MDSKDRALGMGSNITRRDFLNGVALTVGAAIVPSPLLAAIESEPEASPEYYPPSLTGLRGSHPGSFEAAHAMRDGTLQLGEPVATGEIYDLVIVGGGLSGLAAAHFFRKVAADKARILIIENHDDFGGHAKRNEFTAGNRKLLGYGGTFSIESPSPYSPVAKGLIEELGIDVAGYSKLVDKTVYSSRSLGSKIFFDKETFGVDKLLDNPAPLAGSETSDLERASSSAWKTFLAEAPLAEQARKDVQRLHLGNKDYMPGLTADEKKARMARMSYAKFLTDVAGAHPDVIRLYQTAPHPLFGVGIDAVSAQDAWGLGFPGFSAMNLGNEPGKGINHDAVRSEEAENYFFHFPDGNASIARLLVRKLIPQAIAGSSSTDVISARADYSKLDQPSSPVRIRLNSTAIKVRHLGDHAKATEVEITYARRGKSYTVKGKNCVLACWHAVIPYICDELPEPQKEALASAAKVPLLYTNVVLRNWTSFEKLKAVSVSAPGSYHENMNLDLPVSLGDYHCPRSPEQPIVIHMSKTPCKPGLPARSQHRVGRAELLRTSFDTMERNIRDQLARTLAGGDFDPARDIAAITVNRWPHGYAYEYNSLWDKFWLEGGPQPCEVARQPFGRISIANSDAAAYAYTDAAFDQAYRAVQEISNRSAAGA